MACSAAGAEAAELLAEVDDVLVYEAPWMKATDPQPDGSLLGGVVDMLRERRFDAAVVFTVYSQSPLPGYGTCVVTVCLSRAHAPLGLCARHHARYDRDGRPGGAMLPVRWWNRYERIGEPVPIDYADEQAFRRWCATTAAPPGFTSRPSAAVKRAGSLTCSTTMRIVATSKRPFAW